jgi:uncharacterized repeat protein (TIGR01451 family)
MRPRSAAAAVAATLALLFAGSTGVVPAQAPSSADLAASKSGPDTTTADTDITYTLGITNPGPDDASDATLSDPLPSGTTFVSVTQATGPTFSCSGPAVDSNGTVTCSTASLPSGESATFTLVAHVAADATRGSYVTNQDTVSTSTPDPNDENNSAPSSALVGPVTRADFRVTKSDPEAAPPGSDVSYSLDVANGGPDSADATLTDALPGDMTFVSLARDSGPTFSCTTPAVGSGGTVSCSIAAMDSGAESTFTLVAHIPSGESSGTTYTNQASVSTSASDPTSENDESSVATTVGDADLSATKSAPPEGYAGGTLTYALGIANAGPDAAGTATLTDALPSHTTFVSLTQDTGPTFGTSTPAAGQGGTVTASTASLASGASATFTLVVSVDPSTPDGTTIANTATASSETGDPDSTNNSRSASTVAHSPPGGGPLAPFSPASSSPGAGLPPTAPAGTPGRPTCPRVPDLLHRTLRGARRRMDRLGCDVPLRVAERVPPRRHRRRRIVAQTPAEGAATSGPVTVTLGYLRAPR